MIGTFINVAAALAGAAGSDSSERACPPGCRQRVLAGLGLAGPL